MTRPPFKLVACTRIYILVKGGVDVAPLKPHENQKSAQMALFFSGCGAD